MFENHTILRVYGVEEEPYLLPTFLTPRIYAIEYFKQRFILDHKHFASNNKSITFKLPQKIGPFMVRSRTTKTIVEYLWRDLKFQQGEKINYDPFHVISEKKEAK